MEYVTSSSRVIEHVSCWTGCSYVGVIHNDNMHLIIVRHLTMGSWPSAQVLWSVGLRGRLTDFPRPRINVKLSLYLTEHHDMEAYWGSGGIVPSFLHLGIGWRWVVRFTSRERAPGTHSIGGWVGPRTVLDAVGKRKIPSLRRESNPRIPIIQPVAQPQPTIEL
jgi:hypothetical protein